MKKFTSVLAGLLMLVCVNLSAAEKVDVVKAIQGGNQNKIERALQNATQSDIKDALTFGEIVDAVEMHGSADKMDNVVIYMINGLLSNKDKQVRSDIYDELAKVSYKKMNFVLKPLVTEYFKKKKDPDTALNAKLKAVKTAMVSAK